MRLKSIYVEGFKSYATPTHIGEFDPAFNAITGLNGSGKSNILDAICFAMGITTLSSVRVANLQELIYKQGTAGITKASVTLVFDNSDRSQSPTGYENDPEISVTRQIHVSQPCKYMINGRKALATEVSNMFRSVQLNVNNPHFLIMQGRITKVLNMKPEEIRDMLQEALGTLMYETKKQEAQKKMAQKEIKVQAINETLENQITPRVEKLREDKKDYDRFNAIVQDIQRHRRFLIAYDFHTKHTVSVDGRKELEDIADKMDAAKTFQKSALASEKSKSAELSEYRKKDSQAKKPFQEAEAEEKTASQALVRAAANKDAVLEDLKMEKVSLEQKQARLEEVERLIASSGKDIEEAQHNVEAQQENVAKSRVACDKARQGVDSAETGSSDRIQEELMDLQKQEQEHSTAIKMSDMTIKAKSDARKKLEKELNQAKKEEERSNATHGLEALKEKLSTAKSKVDAFGPALSAAPPGETLADLSTKAKQLKTSTGGYVTFKFDQAALQKGDKCYGRLAGLVRLDDSKAATYARAMEVVAGAKLTHVVVDTKETSKRILEQGKLAQRVTVVPLNATSVNVMDEDRVKLAESKAKKLNGWACLALDVLAKSDIPEDIWPAMKYAFGQTLICDSSATAKALAFDEKVKAKCVTLEGDLFDPSGTLTGGSRDKGDANAQPLLLDLHTLYKFEQMIAKRATDEKKDQERTQALREVESIQHEVDMAMEKAKESKVFRLEEKIREANEEVSKAEATKADSQAVLKDLATKIAELKDMLKNSQQLKQKLIAEAKNAEKQSKKQLKESEDALQRALKRLEELESIRKRSLEELVELKSAVAKQDESMDNLETQLGKLEQEYAEKSAEYQKKRAAREEKERAMQSWDARMQALESEVAAASDKARELEMELKQLEARQAKLKLDVKGATEGMTALKKEHLWIEKEMQFFGKPHTEYDFEVKDPAEVQKKYKELEEVQVQLSRSINKKALAMMEKAEEEYDSLDRKRRTIESDRIAIERVIAGLDRKKNEALVAAYEKVNKDFGSIFSMLLPGARAELRPLEGCTVLDGLEVKVAFGQTWKDSLAELSGGQRSLLALSLVLALLRFKPAPLYILDEVDAALDLSHTQNIGVMLRTHFSESQFIVVSLKEGMFSNANCVFRTKFVDGVSTVTRTVNRVLTDANTNTSSGVEDAKTLLTKKKANSKKRVATGEDENAQEVEN